MTRPMIAQDGPWTVTVPRDEWASEFQPVPPLTDTELGECAARLSTLHELEGAQSESLMVWAITVMVERGPGARSLLRMLRSLEGQA